MSRNASVTILVAILIVGGYFLLTGEKAIAPSDGVSNTMPVLGSDVPEAVVEEATGTVITYSASGYSPTPVTIKIGDTVTFKNESAIDMRPASAMHPTHTVYPGSDIQKCGTVEEKGIFDSCRSIKPLDLWSFTFTEKGSWNYHDHLTPKYFGKIIVE